LEKYTHKKKKRSFFAIKQHIIMNDEHNKAFDF
jgi:hypothetical protein